MVLTSRPFSLSVSSSNFFAASGTFMTWSCADHTFLGELFTLDHTFMDDLFAFDYTFMDELIRTRKCTNTKKTRKKDEENTKETRNFAYFSSDEGENHRAKTAR